MTKRTRLLSLLLVCAMLLCSAVLALPAFAAGAEYESDEAAAAAGYAFRVEGKYYKTLAECYAEVPENGTVYMIADYTNSVGCEDVGKGATEVRTFTIEGGNHTYITDKNHGLHFHNSNVIVNGMNYNMTGEGAGARVEYTTTLTLKNCTWEKTDKSANAWSPAMIVYGTLVMDENSVLKNNNEKSDKQSNGIWMEAKKPDGTVDETIVPKVVLKANARVEAWRYVFYEKVNTEIEILSREVTLVSPHADKLPVVRRINQDENPASKLTFAGPTDADYEDPEAKEAWKLLYTQMGETWFDAPQVDEDTIRGYRPVMSTASVRMKEDSYGLRFSTEISSEAVKFADGLVKKGVMQSYSFGTLIVRQDDVKDMTEVTEEALTAANIKFLKVAADKGIVRNVDGSVTLNTALTNIKEENRNVNFCAISYIAYVYAGEDARTLTVYAAPGEIASLADAAWHALADVSQEVVSGCSNPLHRYWKLQDGAYVEVEGDVYTKYSKAQRELLLSFTSDN